MMKTALWLATTISLACIASGAFGAGQNDDVAKAEKIANTTCISCHDIRKICIRKAASA